MLSRLTTPLLVVVIGIAAVIFGLIRSDEPTCGSGDEFGPGKVCQVAQKGQPVRKTYEEMRAERVRTNLWIPVIGVAVIIAGLGYGAAMLSRGQQRPNRARRPGQSAGHGGQHGVIPPIPSVRDARPVNVPRAGSPVSSSTTPAVPTDSYLGSPATSGASGPPRGSDVPRPGEHPPQYWPARNSTQPLSGQSAPLPQQAQLHQSQPPQQFPQGQQFQQGQAQEPQQGQQIPQGQQFQQSQPFQQNQRPVGTGGWPPKAEPADMGPRTGQWQHKPPPTPMAPMAPQRTSAPGQAPWPDNAPSRTPPNHTGPSHMAPGQAEQHDVTRPPPPVPTPTPEQSVAQRQQAIPNQPVPPANWPGYETTWPQSEATPPRR